MVASAGKPCFAPIHPLCVQCGKPWEAPGRLCEKPHNDWAEAEQNSTDSPLLSKWVLLILPGWWNQIIITGSITGAAVTLARMISRNSNPMLLFINSPAREPGQREHKPQQQGAVALRKGSPVDCGCCMWRRGHIICGRSGSRSTGSPGSGLQTWVSCEERHSAVLLSPPAALYSRHRNSINMPWM